MLGTSSTTAYIESAAGTSVGGRTGLTAVVVALLFLAALVIAPLAGTVPAFATAPALCYVAVLMVRGLAEIEWDDLTPSRRQRGDRDQYAVYLLDRARYRFRLYHLCPIGKLLAGRAKGTVTDGCRDRSSFCAQVRFLVRSHHGYKLL